ncbi:NAD-dependent epimerase/dehydratase family protein [Streptomyces sp. NPDC059688]|uniref:NAD-dependent epimerase/dehydratase family protein n=1 Tax=Streptomyces sp. NPDC059688 TaxID=3346906 RepID=UPI0036BEB9DA
MRPTRVVLTGATGFIGSAVLHQLARLRVEAGGPAYVCVVGRRLPAGTAGLADEWTPADLGEPGSLRGVCDGADVLLHLAASQSSNEAYSTAVNVHGTAALMREAARSGVRRIVHLSTAAVYGPGPHRGIGVDEVVPAPLSVPSRTRLAGEKHALAAGACVLRPGLVLGRGDRWVVPALAQLITAVPALWGGGRARVSMVAVEDLSRLIAHIATVAPLQGPRVWHASHPDPVTTRDLLAALTRHLGLPAVSAELAWDECRSRLRASPCRLNERQLALVARDHWYDSREVWRRAACDPGPGPLSRVPEAAPWYRSLLAPVPDHHG